MATFPEVEPVNQTQESSNPRISPRQFLTGTQSGRQIIRVKGAIIINDGTNDRVIIGDLDAV